MTCRTQERRLLPPLTPEEQKSLASAILLDWHNMTRGKAGATLAIHDGVTCITAKSKPAEVIAARMAMYRRVPLLFVLFIRRHTGQVFDKLDAHMEQVFPEVYDG